MHDWLAYGTSGARSCCARDGVSRVTSIDVEPLRLETWFLLPNRSHAEAAAALEACLARLVHRRLPAGQSSVSASGSSRSQMEVLAAAASLECHRFPARAAEHHDVRADAGRDARGRALALSGRRLPGREGSPSFDARGSGLDDGAGLLERIEGWPAASISPRCGCAASTIRARACASSPVTTVKSPTISAARCSMRSKSSARRFSGARPCLRCYRRAERRLLGAERFGVDAGTLSHSTLPRHSTAAATGSATTRSSRSASRLELQAIARRRRRDPPAGERLVSRADWSRGCQPAPKPATTHWSRSLLGGDPRCSQTRVDDPAARRPIAARASSRRVRMRSMPMIVVLTGPAMTPRFLTPRTSQGRHRSRCRKTPREMPCCPIGRAQRVQDSACARLDAAVRTAAATSSEISCGELDDVAWAGHAVESKHDWPKKCAWIELACRATVRSLPSDARDEPRSCGPGMAWQ